MYKTPIAAASVAALLSHTVAVATSRVHVLVFGTTGACSSRQSYKKGDVIEAAAGVSKVSCDIWRCRFQSHPILLVIPHETTFLNSMKNEL